MLRISKMTDYAIMVMVELNASRGEVLNAHALAERSHLELPTVSKVLKLLVKKQGWLIPIVVPTVDIALNVPPSISAWQRLLRP